MMSLPDCITTIARCRNTWKDALNILDAMRLARRVQRRIQEVLGETDLSKFDREHLDRLRDWIGTAADRRSFKACFANPGSCAQSSAKMICEKFISLGKDDLLQELTSVSSKTISEEDLGPKSRAAWSARSGRNLQFIDTKASQTVLVVRDYQVPPGSVVPSYNNNQLQGDSP